MGTGRHKILGWNWLSMMEIHGNPTWWEIHEVTVWWRLDDHNINTTTSKPLPCSCSFSRNLYWEKILKNRAEEMNEAGFVQNQWVETLWNCCPHTYNTPLYPAINMEMTRKRPVDTSTMISNHQTRLKQQHPPLPMWALLVTRIRGRLAHVYRGALTLITTLGLPKNKWNESW